MARAIDHFHDLNVLSTFRAWADDPALKVLAIHTTDFNGPVIELALLGSDGEKLYHSRFYTPAPISPSAYEKHGISAEDLKGLPTLAEEWPRIAPLLSGTVLAYAPDFVVKALKRSLSMAPAEDQAMLSEIASPSRNVIEAFAWIAGKPSKTALKSGYSYVSLEEAYRMAGHVDGSVLLGKGADGGALKVLRVINWAAKRTIEDLPHLLTGLTQTSDLFSQAEEQEALSELAQADAERDALGMLPVHVPSDEVSPAPVQQQPALSQGTEPEPLGDKYRGLAVALRALVKAGLLREARPLMYALPDQSFWYQATAHELTEGGELPRPLTGLDRLAQAACELWLSKQDSVVSLSQSSRFVTEPRYWAAIHLTSGVSISVDDQPSPGLALVNLLAAADLAGLA